MKSYSYTGSELELFAEAINWKNYFSLLIDKYLGDAVLDVGAGIGTTTQILCKGNQKIWICLDPDPFLANKIETLIERHELPSCCRVRVVTLSDLAEDEVFDTILYIDVLEHIEDDRHELQMASRHLVTSGRLIILSPAHQWLFTPFDKAIGHYRRYDKKSLSSLVPDNLKCLRLLYLDSVGLLASLGNKLILNKSMPSRLEINILDRFMVPVSRVIDPLIQYSIGKSILGIWQKKS